VTNVIRHSVRVKSVLLHDVLNAFLNRVFFQFFQKCFKVALQRFTRTINLCLYLSHCDGQVEFSGNKAQEH
jgi:hypothetical protein